MMGRDLWDRSDRAWNRIGNSEGTAETIFLPEGCHSIPALFRVRKNRSNCA